MNCVYLYNTPVDKTIRSLEDFYNNYNNLKDFVFSSLNSSKLLVGVLENSNVLIKPNWVFHNQKESDELCLTTHPNLILAVLEYVLSLKPARIIIGDSPVQSCNWSSLHSPYFIDQVSKLQKEHNIQIGIVDFRNEKWESKRHLKKNCRGANEYYLFDLDSNSLLNPLSIQKKEFRVGDYDPDQTTKNHNEGIHKYLIAKEVIDSDIIINLPKLKTHQKAGITNGLKNHVGTIGDKACLAHHSSNLAKSGGDCYPGNNIIRKTAEFFCELSYKYKGKLLYFPFHYLSSIIWRMAPKSNYANLSGSWYGNDTVWRMTLDINKIINNGTTTGEITEKLQRRIITISDAIIGGHGEGPLEPTPLPVGLLAVSNSDGLLDLVMARIYDFDANKIPLLKYFTGHYSKDNSQIFVDNARIDYNELNKYAIKAIPSKGWENFIEI